MSNRGWIIAASAALLPLFSMALDKFVAWLAKLIHRALPEGRVKDFLARH